ncbi:MAG: NAD(P)-dependent alcohol dehydrogenase [Candidatus Lokiarchaeota archaeon]|nr:NAD(P)-dependent alcohol dehydrogenase [Candidatus Lokiarchaeota archaeon]
MKAVVYKKYGPPEVMKIEEVEIPTPNNDEVLVKVHAVSVNFADWTFVRGKPRFMRLMGGFPKPKYKTLGSDIAGTVEAVGSNVEQFQIGDDVFADSSDNGWGGFAEYISVPENILVTKPSNLTFEEAAAVPQAAVVALQGLRDIGGIQSGQKVLINGASGGIGTFAVQIAKSFGAEVTGVCSTKNLEMVKSIGADHVIDYTQEDFTKGEHLYDLILDVVAFRSISDYKRVLTPNGNYVLTGGSMYRIIQAIILGGKKVKNYTAKSNQKDLVFMKELIEAGKVVPVVDTCYPLSEVAEAVRYYGERHAKGKVVITVKHKNKT